MAMPPERRTERLAGVRSLLASKPSGVLCTHSERMPGFPYGSLAPFSLDGDGSPVFLLSGLAVHSKNLRMDARASLLVAQDDGVAGARVNLFGEVRPFGAGEAVRESYLARHPEASQWVGFGDFAFYRMEVANIYYVGGFGEMGWVPASGYRRGV